MPPGTSGTKAGVGPVVDESWAWLAGGRETIDHSVGLQKLFCPVG